MDHRTSWHNRTHPQVMIYHVKTIGHHSDCLARGASVTHDTRCRTHVVLMSYCPRRPRASLHDLCKLRTLVGAPSPPSWASLRRLAGRRGRQRGHGQLAQRVRRQHGATAHCRGRRSHPASRAARSGAPATPTLLAELVRDWRRAPCGWASCASPTRSSTAARTANKTSSAHAQCCTSGVRAAAEEERARTAAGTR